MKIMTLAALPLALATSLGHAVDKSKQLIIGIFKSFREEHMNPVVSKRAGLVVAIVAVIVGMPAIAQVNQSEAIEEVIVTGSRIARSSAELPTPTTVIDAESLERTGASNLGDVLHSYPAMLAGIGNDANNDSNSNFNLKSAGLELVNLRGLGTERTLVLVNGRRHVAGQPGTSAVDLAMIPTALIERVDIITGGASAIYGADAITGVVNLILKDDFEGLQLDLKGGISGKSDGDRSDINVTWGSNFHEGRGNVTLSGSYTDEEAVLFPARPFANRNPAFLANSRNTGPADGIADEVLAQDVRYTPINGEGIMTLINSAGSFPPAQNIIFGLPGFPDNPLGIGTDRFAGGALNFLRGDLPDGASLYDAFTIDRETGEVRPFQSGSPARCIACDGGDGFRTNETNTLSSPLERTVLNMYAKYDFEDLTMFAQAKYGKSESGATGQGAIFHDGNFGPYIDMQRDNPFLPAALAAEMDARGLTHAPLAVVGLNSAADNTRETYQITIGGNGTFNNGINYDFYGQYGNVDVEIQRADILTSRYFQALAATTDASGNAVCRDPSDGCLPLNPFNKQASAEARAYVDGGVVDTAEIEQTVFGFSFSGDAFNLPAGEVQYAAGLEYRKEESSFTPDILSQAFDPETGIGLGLVGGELAFNPDENRYRLPSAGEYDATELFGEVTVPLLTDKPMAQSLTMDLAARYTDHSITGGDSTYKTGFNWTLNDTLRLRTTFSKAVRSPNIDELFKPNESTGQFVADACHTGNLDGGPNAVNRQANCLALGIPANFSSLADVSTRTIVGSGNDQLDPEEADTYTLGAVISLGDSFTFTMDYWDIEITDAITQFEPNDILSSCVDGAALDDSFCSLIVRADSHQISRINVTNINAAEFLASGIDIEANYGRDLGAGILSLSATTSYLDELQTKANANSDTAGPRILVDSFGYPRWRGLIDTVYSFDKFQISWLISYVGSSKWSNDGAPEQYLGNNEVDAVVYHDLNLRYTHNDHLQLFAGVNNLLDEEPPNMPEINTGGLLYDAMGSYYFFGLRYRL